MSVSCSTSAPSTSSATSIVSPAEPQAPLQAMETDFEDWLTNVDPTGGLLAYLEVFKENFDSVAQLLKTFVLEDDGLHAFDNRLFEELGVEDPEHVRMFDRWISTNSRASAECAEQRRLTRGVRDWQRDKAKG